MTARIAAPLYPGGRHCLLVGDITAGAIFPPVGDGGKWVWRFWLSGALAAPEGHCKTEAAARRAILAEWQSFLDRAGLMERMTPKEASR